MDKNIIEVKDLKVHFEVKKSFSQDVLGKGKKLLRAIDGISLNIREGEIYSLVGESGCGKTTTGKALLGLVKPTSGKVLYKGADINNLDKHKAKDFRRKAQMIYQDPYQSMNPRDTIMDIVAEALDVNHLVKTEKERTERVNEALVQAGLFPPKDYSYRYPHELSGGQRQRVVIAGAIIMNPEFIVADEPVSMLDASIRTGILKLMLDLREKEKLTYLFITHDLSLSWLVSDRIAIMYLGKIMEEGLSDDIIKRGLHPYTKALTAIMPIPGAKRKEKRDVLPGEAPNPLMEVTGCKFASRCPIAKPICLKEEPQLREVAKGHFCACHFV
ncbi:MAG: ABC transporter ATP-binding protein [Anaerovoracaceae bacterium]